MCSLPLHTAEQIGEVVRSHNTRGQPGDDEGCRQDGAELNVETTLKHVDEEERLHELLDVKSPAQCVIIYLTFHFKYSINK